MIEKERNGPLIIPDRIYGELEITDLLAIELIESPTFRRLHHIAQMGVYGYAIPEINTTRFEHSIGVYYLLQCFGASREEQIAGLLHDVSHPAFSHVVDHVFGSNTNQDFQDNVHTEFVFNSELPEIIRNHHLAPGAVINYYNYPLLEQTLPDLCADRIDYFLRDGFVCGILTESDVEMILGAFMIVDGKWVITESTIAQFYFEKNLVMARDWWAPDWGVLQFQLMAQAIQGGLDAKVITKNDLFLTDAEVWAKLEHSGKPQILRRIEQVRNIQNIRFEPSNPPFDFPLRSKYRGTDPLIHRNSKLKRISRFNASMAKEANAVKEKIESIRYVKIIE